MAWSDVLGWLFTGFVGLILVVLSILILSGVVRHFRPRRKR
jgi:hypothetical protein